MIAELGVYSLILAWLLSCALVIIPSLGIFRNKIQWIQAATFYTKIQFLLIALSYLLLTICFLQNDFSVLYVLNNSSVDLPWFYKICAVWGGHEGSMLLWVAILSFWTLLVSLGSKSLDELTRARVLVVLGFLNAGLILFILSTSNPFLRQFQQLQTTGRDLNPLLQDLGFLFHPPMLYMGYVGFSVAFAFAIAALWAGKMESAWCKWTRPWTLAAWSCLTAGITLGSWWAYRELGWGGWWFWDPVENASFMPWLTGTALIHSLAVSEKRKQFQNWTILLSIIAFSLSLVGTFLVRSGVLTSVHAFAVDPLRGLYILFFLMIVIGGSLLLFVIRASELKNQSFSSLLSRENVLLLNNLFLIVIMLTVLMGTIYPLLIDGMGLGKLSVGAPYFNTVFVPLLIPLLFLMGWGIHLRWGHDSLGRLGKRLWWIFIIAFLVPIVVIIYHHKMIYLNSTVGLGFACWILFSTFYALYQKFSVQGLSSITQAYWGMTVAHVGIAIAVIGVAVSSTYGIQDDVVLQEGSRVNFAGYQIEFIDQQALQGPNYKGTKVHLRVIKELHEKDIFPEKRLYNVAQMAMTESAIDVNPFRDIYVVLGESLNDKSWSVRIYYKPLIRWIWGGGFMILLGGIIALTDRRYYLSRPKVGESKVV